MKRKEVRQLGEAELDKTKHDLVEEIGKLRLQKATGQLENVHLIREKRRLLARIFTLQKEKTKTPVAK